MASAPCSSDMHLRLLLNFLVPAYVTVLGYHRKPCTRQASADFSFDDCYLPSMNPELALAEASFVFSHDAATGYIRPNSLSPDGLTWSYTKTQKGSFYQQLQDGARALDLRPTLLSDGKVVFHHGKITIRTISFQNALSDVVRWCEENPSEIVLLLTSHYAFGSAQSSGTNDMTDDDAYDDNSGGQYDQTDQNSAMVAVLKEIYSEFGILYLSCEDVYGWTVQTVLDQASLANGGVLLALDGQSTYPGGLCAKSNYIEDEIVTCWTNETSCKTSDQPYQRLAEYVLQSANNDATDDSSQLGPPNDLYRYPLNQIQALWQVSAQSAVIGLAHFSNILADDHDSGLHVKLVELIHQESMPASISLFTMDNVALHGNAILSVLRNRCGQSILADVPCGPDLPPPRIEFFHLEPWVVMATVMGMSVMAFLLFSFRHNSLKMGKKASSSPRQSSNDSKREALVLRHPESTLT